MPRRRDRVAPPPRPGEWDVRFEDNASAKGWEQVCRESSSSARAAWEALAAEPRRRTARQHRLKGPLRVGRINGVEMEQWQYEPATLANHALTEWWGFEVAGGGTHRPGHRQGALSPLFHGGLQLLEEDGCAGVRMRGSSVLGLFSQGSF